jgi:hypothetical protein
VDIGDKSKGCIARFYLARTKPRAGEFWDGLPAGFTDWHIRPSGYAGPFVMQLDTPRGQRSEA